MTSEAKEMKPNKDVKDNKMSKLEVAPKAPDGGWGWLVVFGSFLIHVVADGLMYSVGLFYVEFLDDFGSTKGETSVVASLMVGISLLSGPLASALVNRYHCRVTAIIGAVIAAVGFLVSAWAPNIYFLYFSYGILSGIGFGLLIHPAVVAVGQYFDKRRSLATGMAVCGTGLGMFVFPPLISVLINAYAWQGASIVLAGILLNLCICGAVFRPLKPTVLYVPDDDADVKLLAKDTEPEIKSQSRLDTQDDVLGHLGSFADIYALSRSEMHIPEHGNNESGIGAFFSELKHELKTTTNFALLKDFPFLIFAFSGTLTSIGFNAPYIFVPHLAELNGVNESEASMLISIIGITNIIGRVAFGFVGDRLRTRRLYLFCGCTIFTGLFTALCPLCTTYPLMAIYSGFFGFTFGGIVALNWVLLPDLMGVEHYAASLGICMLFDGISTPIGPPFLGWVFDFTGNYDASFIIGGTMILVSGLILLPIPCIRSRRLTYHVHAKGSAEHHEETKGRNGHKESA